MSRYNFPLIFPEELTCLSFWFWFIQCNLNSVVRHSLFSNKGT